MFAYVGNSRKDLGTLYAALKKAAEYDRTVTWSKDKQHRDGWGCVILTRDGLIHYRTRTPIFDDDFRLPAFRGRVYSIFHARKASGAKGNPIFSQPFVAESDRKVFFLAHIGELKAHIPKNTVDTEHALRKIVEKGGLENALTQLKKETKTALNLLLLEIDRESRGAGIRVFNHWKPGKEDEYYRLYRKGMGGGRAVFSSTLNYGLGGEACARDEILKL
jgi:glutamine amidotransferase